MAEVKEEKSFKIDYVNAINKFSSAMQKFPVKKILYRTLFRGRGLEFESYRSFQPDDDASFIDWKASLRSNTLLAKKYIEERDLRVYFFVDVSSGMLFGSGDRLKSEYAAEFIAALAHLVMEAGDMVGLVLFADGITKFVPPANGKKHFYMLTKILADPKNYGGDFVFDKPVDYVLKTVKTDYTIFILVSDFIRMRKTIGLPLKMLSSRFETLAVMIRDPMDEVLPNTKFQLSISDPYSDRQLILDTELAYEKYRESAFGQKKRVKELFSESNIDLLELKTDVDFYLTVASFLRSRARGQRI
jgi:uncharacterized protein (DUF58 family)